MANPPPIKNTEELPEDWLTTYADAITLLLCFFVVMFSISEPNTEKFEAVSKGIVESLSKKEVETPFRDLRKDLTSIATDAGQQSSVETTTRGFVYPFRAARMFAPGSADILPAAEEQLDRIAQLLTLQLGTVNYKVTVEGHTDDVPINTPRFPSNWELSSARASAVVRFLISRGVTPDRLSAIGFAESQPVEGSFTVDPQNPARKVFIPEKREDNRRIVIKVER